MGGALGKLYKLIEDTVLGVTFFVLISPVSMAIRLMGRDVLNQKLYGAQKSYWVEYVQARSNPQDFYRQCIKK